MLFGKLRYHTYKIVLLTSIFWLLLMVVVISFYSNECIGGSCKKSREDQIGEQNALVADKKIEYEDTEDEE